MTTTTESEFEIHESWFQRYGLYLAWLVALVATCGSLYFSEIRGFIPCDLCWYQRIFMYPLVIVLGIAAYRGDRRIIGYVLPMSIIGMLISIYHNFEIWFPKVGEMMPCRSGIPCNYDYLNWLGFITIPLMALTAFILIIIFLVLGREKNN
ncbi:disulfide oxidoreductase [Paenibacillus glycanilyticus]|uniref:Disulfide bond formation protein C n=1 Tax=Paenibacillus glycanilyticus TaxID=126569 RepID=A0ABQ6GKJ9_9BACL|nr:disulfide oxidoreductase [Paenibacillus glycanilyticus]GLX70760.1 disulfide bond formation protein C [Paenibacillus glycanilyticus]